MKDDDESNSCSIFICCLELFFNLEISVFKRDIKFSGKDFIKRISIEMSDSYSYRCSMKLINLSKY